MTMRAKRAPVTTPTLRVPPSGCEHAPLSPAPRVCPRQLRDATPLPLDLGTSTRYPCCELAPVSPSTYRATATSIFEYDADIQRRESMRQRGWMHVGSAVGDIGTPGSEVVSRAERRGARGVGDGAANERLVRLRCAALSGRAWVRFLFLVLCVSPIFAMFGGVPGRTIGTSATVPSSYIAALLARIVHLSLPRRALAFPSARVLVRILFDSRAGLLLVHLCPRPLPPAWASDASSESKARLVRVGVYLHRRALILMSDLFWLSLFSVLFFFWLLCRPSARR
ncbi:hypothetical protein C8R44DRAFT_870503 [Mycena epipterygia]|nr:hypothetical protein C8R44DRAFT_870503 [Mycena epipterygia]